MALWEAPITPTVCASLLGRILARRGGFNAGSRPMSIRLSTGRGLVVGDAPVQRTSRSAETVVGPGNFSSGELIVTLQLFDLMLSAHNLWSNILVVDILTSDHVAPDTSPSCLWTPFDSSKPFVSIRHRSAAWAI